VRPALTVDVPRFAVIVAVWEETTVVVTIVKVVLVWPEAIVADAGTWTLELLDERVTCTPVVGAGSERVTVPATGFPPTTEVVLRVRLSSVGGVIAGCTMKLADWELPPPGGGFVTTTESVPALASWETLRVTVNWLAVTNVAACDTPFTITVEEATNPLPLMVTVRAGEPAFAELGDREEMVGVGFGATTLCTTKL
jgi:hypothetical protein